MSKKRVKANVVSVTTNEKGIPDNFVNSKSLNVGKTEVTKERNNKNQNKNKII